jgi:hypothetical protein
VSKAFRSERLTGFMLLLPETSIPHVECNSMHPDLLLSTLSATRTIARERRRIHERLHDSRTAHPRFSQSVTYNRPSSKRYTSINKTSLQSTFAVLCHPSPLLTTPRFSSHTVTRTRLPLLELPQKVWIRLVRQHLSNKLRARPQIPALAEYLLARNIDLAPSRLDQSTNTSSVHILLETSPSDRTGAHGTAFGVRV